jgi:hypothetical protein
VAKTLAPSAISFSNRTGIFSIANEPQEVRRIVEKPRLNIGLIFATMLT